MKTSKAASKTSAEEECGIWLDTVQLKEKTKKKYTRPISKLLNPFTKGSGYSLAVALNFTQTKIEMPKTKQSTISTFFTTHRRVLNKNSTSEAPNADPVQPSLSSTSTALTVQSGRKRGRDTGDEEADLLEEWKSEGVSESKETLWHSSSPHIHSEFEDGKPEECEPPQSKKRHPDSSLVSDSQPLPQAWSQDPLLTFSQYSDSELYLPDQRFNVKNLNSSGKTIADSLQSEEAFENVTNGERRTSTQKSLNRRRSPENDDDQENSVPFVLSQIWTEPNPATSQEHLHRLQKETEEEKLGTEWIKPKSPLKKRARQSQHGGDEDSLAALFTQDSQGIRVIAHRGLQARSPFKDHSNLTTRTVNTYRPLVWEEEEDDDLFTQDSQGNLVIKH